ncbi:unnamed protein product [Paramecium primaurelia]|uniref:Transmembrane protein n=1 Tax=Paramecium primaurelia TaxID=5886 RepID=A0A8S1QR08_PARPR|nr:unnamed protein product [Paramecium primaurelia]
MIIRENMYNYQFRIIVNITLELNNEKFLDYCLSKLQSFYFKVKIELRQINILYYINFQNDSYFYIYNYKQNKIIISINRDKFVVLETQGDYYIVNKNYTNHLRVIQFKDEQLLQLKIKFQEEIINAQKISQSVNLYIIIQTYLLQYNKIFNQIYIENIDKHILYYFFLILLYLSKSLYQSEPILFYQEMGYQKFTQYQNVIAVQNQGNIRCFKFQVGLINSIANKDYSQQQYDAIQQFYIKNLTRSLTLNYYYELELVFLIIYFHIHLSTQETLIIQLFYSTIFIQYILIAVQEIIVQYKEAQVVFNQWKIVQLKNHNQIIRFCFTNQSLISTLQHIIIKSNLTLMG